MLKNKTKIRNSIIFSSSFYPLLFVCSIFRLIYPGSSKKIFFTEINKANYIFIYIYKDTHTNTNYVFLEKFKKILIKYN
jgi:hypothetical protein